jgi:hypothetical protein
MANAEPASAIMVRAASSSAVPEERFIDQPDHDYERHHHHPFAQGRQFA